MKLILIVCIWVFINKAYTQLAQPSPPEFTLSDMCVITNIQTVYDIVPGDVRTFSLFIDSTLNQPINTTTTPGPKFTFFNVAPSFSFGQPMLVSVRAENLPLTSNSDSVTILITSFTISGLSSEYDAINRLLVLNWTTSLDSTHSPLSVGYVYNVRFIYSNSAGILIGNTEGSVPLNSDVQSYSINMPEGSSAVFSIISVDLVADTICNIIIDNILITPPSQRLIQSPVTIGAVAWNPLTLDCSLFSTTQQTLDNYEFRFQNSYLSTTQVGSSSLLGGVFPSGRITITSTPSPAFLLTGTIGLNTYAPTIDVNRLFGCRATYTATTNTVEESYIITTATNSSKPPIIKLFDTPPSSSFSVVLTERIDCTISQLYAVWNNSYGEPQMWPPSLFLIRRVWGLTGEYSISTSYSSGAQRYTRSLAPLQHNLNTYYNYTIQVMSDAGNSIESDILYFYVGTAQISNLAFTHDTDRAVLTISWMEMSNSTIFGYIVNYRIEINYGNTNELSEQTVQVLSYAPRAYQSIHERSVEYKIYQDLSINILNPGFAILRVSVNVDSQCGLDVCDTILTANNALHVYGYKMLVAILLLVVLVIQY